MERHPHFCEVRYVEVRVFLNKTHQKKHKSSRTNTPKRRKKLILRGESGLGDLVGSDCLQNAGVFRSLLKGTYRPGTPPYGYI